MAGPLYFDRVMESTVSVGTGTYTLAGAVAGYQSFAVVGDGNTAPYCVFSVDANGVPNGGWEVGLGTYTSAGTTIARTIIYSNSNGDLNPVNWGAGTKRVCLTEPAQAQRSVTIVAASDESDSDNTLHDDAELFFSMPAGSVYEIEFLGFFTTGTSTTPDVKATFTLPSGATYSTLSLAYQTAETVVTVAPVLSGNYQSTSGGAVFGRGVVSTATLGATPFYQRGVIRNPTNAGTAQLQWAQNVTTGGTPTVRKADSFLRYTRVS